MARKQTEEIYFEDVAGVAIAVAVHYARTDGGGESFVVMAHGFHGDKTGGARHFVDLARDLARRGISTLRFDQPGNGDSAGNFEDASFDRWVATVKHFAERLSSAGHKVALLGESMGAVATMAAAADLGKRICGTALWSAGPLLGARTEPPKDGWMEEGGQQVSWNYCVRPKRWASWKPTLDSKFQLASFSEPPITTHPRKQCALSKQIASRVTGSGLSKVFPTPVGL
ncbi:MAG: lysophospholipase [Chloroflexota bacterium]|nr:lysophospholipase [Chloroflexota bacterium]